MHIRGEMTSGKWTLSGFVRSRLESLWWFEVDFWPRSVHFRRGPPPFSESPMPSGMGTESLGMIGCIFAENGPLEVALNLVSGVPAGVLRVNSDGFLAPIRSFSKGAPTIFRKHMPSGMGTESLGVIGCIFAENGPLEGGIESSFWGTGWGAKGDFMRYSYLYPYIFESRAPHTFFESTCPELYEQQSWEWSDAYSRRNDLWKVNFKRVCEKPAGVLMWFEVDFWPRSVLFEGGFWVWAQKVWEWSDRLEGGIESSFWGTGWGAKGDFRRIFGPDPFIFEGGPPPFSESTCPQVWAQKVWEWSDAYSRRMGP